MDKEIEILVNELWKEMYVKDKTAFENRLYNLMPNRKFVYHSSHCVGQWLLIK